MKSDGESENRDRVQNDLRLRLADALAEIDRLRSENARLRSVLETFSLRSASDLAHSSSPRRVPPTEEAVRPAITIDGMGEAEGPSSSHSAVLSPDRKVGIFRSLFRGREDVRQVEEEGLVLVGAEEVEQNFRHNCVPKCKNELKEVTRESPLISSK